jgi:aspartate aminotransferase
LLGVADDNAFAEHLLNHAGVAVVPGSGFGAPGHIRLSFAYSPATLQEALRRMERSLLEGVKA